MADSSLTVEATSSIEARRGLPWKEAVEIKSSNERAAIRGEVKKEKKRRGL